MNDFHIGRPDGVRFRLMALDDYDEVYQLWTQGSGIGLRSLDDSREGIGRFLARNPATCYVAEHGGSVIGVILCGHDGRRGYIYHMLVAAGHRKQGIGTALVDAALAALKEEGILKAALVCFRTNSEGNAFWQEYGFKDRPDLIYRNINLIGEDQNAAR